MSGSWEPPSDWARITTIDAHTGGEPLRVVTGGFPELPGDTILAKRRWCRENVDHLRRAIMLEPRGHADMYGCLLTPPVTPDGDVGVLFLHNEGYSTMCGHGIIGLVTVGLECGLLDVDGDVVRIDSPAGRITATANLEGGRVKSVSFENVPSFPGERDVTLDVPGVGEVRYDLGYGGAFYAYVDAREFGVAVRPENAVRFVDLGRRIKAAVTARGGIRHPDGDADLEFLYGVIFHEPGAATDPVLHSRNVCVFADGEVDRSPTGTGVSGRAAVLHGRGELALGETLEIASLIDTRFRVTAEREVRVGQLTGIVPRVEGSASITGRHEFLIDPSDPLKDGVLVR